MSVIDAAWDVAQDMVANQDISVSTTGADSSSWTYAMSTLDSKSAEISGVLKISPQATYGIGASWTTTSAISMSMAKTLTLTGTNLKVYPFQGEKDIYYSWQPTFKTREPTFSSNGSVSLSGFMQSSINVDAYIFGTKLSAMTLSTSTNFGFNGGLVTVDKQARAPCPGGTYQVVQYNGADQSIYTPSSGFVKLYSQGGYGTPQCVTLPLSPPSDSQVKDLAKMKNAGAFCSSLISYKPPTTTATKTTTVIVATSTTTVIGFGTTTITPSPTTTSITTTLSVVSSPSKANKMAKRTAQQSGSSQPTGSSAASAPSVSHGVLQVREAVHTPILVATWVPQQVSSACSRIATGAITASITVPTTIMSGITTSTVQATVTASIPTVTLTSTSYVPASTPTEVVLAPSFPTANCELTAGAKRTCLGGGNFFADAVLRQCQQRLASDPTVTGYDIGATIAPPVADVPSTMSKVLTGLYPGWTYQFYVRTGTHTATGSCVVQYSLGDDVFFFYSPANDWKTSKFPDRATEPLSVVPTNDTMTLTISMSCPVVGDDKAFHLPSLVGPSAA